MLVLLALAHAQACPQALMESALLALMNPGRAPAMTSAEVSKEAGPPEMKLGSTGKVKECCGYPIGPERGFKMTFYWLAWEAEYANEAYDTEIYTRQGFFLGRFPRTFVYELRLEGSGILRDGRVLNYDGDCPYGVGTCFKQVEPEEHPLGMGSQGRPLEPFRSVAIDPRYIPIGTPLYIPELRGIQMPDGSFHDGCVRADDTGGGIKRLELDFFVESFANYKHIADNLLGDTAITPLVEEPRCAYLRRGDPMRDRLNEAADWLALHRRPTRLAKSSGMKKRPGRGAAKRHRLQVTQHLQKPVKATGRL